MNKDSERLKNIQTTQDKIKNLNYDLLSEEKIEVNIRVVKNVPHGLFKPDPLLLSGWVCTEQTFKAMKKDIFTLGESLDELKQPYQCESCKNSLDRQFWFFCPFCGSSFKE